MKVTKAALAAFLVLSFSPVYAQWARTYGTPADESLVSVTPAVGGGYFVVAVGPNSNTANSIILKIAESGQIIWQKTVPILFRYSVYAAPADIPLYSTPDGGFVVAGIYNYSRLAIIKVDSDGILEWQRIYAGSPAPAPPVLLYGQGGFRLIGTSEGGYLIAGYDRALNSGGIHVRTPILMKITASGDVEWSRYYDLNFEPSAVIQTGDGGYLWTGWHIISYSSSLYQEAILIKTDRSGQVQWVKSLGNGGISSLIRLSNGDLLARVSLSILGFSGFAYIHFNENGEVLWQKAIEENIASCVPTLDGGFLLAGLKSNTFVAAKFDRQHSVEWTKSYSSGSQILPGNDSSYLIAWSGVRAGALKTDLMLAKIGSEGDSTLSCFMDEDVVISLLDFPALKISPLSLSSEEVSVFSTPADLLVRDGGMNSGFLCDETAAVLSVWPKHLTFGAVQGGPPEASQNVLIENSGGGSMSWSIQTSESWIVCSPTSGTGAQMVTVSVDVSGLTPGEYQGQFQISADGAENSPQQVRVELQVYAQGTTAGPFGYFDTPVDGTTGIEGSVPVTGWALDDVEVTKVDIWRDPVGGESVHPNGYVYIGDAVFVEGARPDVEATYPAYPLNYRAGWGYMMLTNFLPSSGNGTFRIHAIAYDRDGHSALIGTKTVTCDNAHATLPFGAIDTPAQGGTWDGTQVNFGWALTPMPKSIPTDGSTIFLWIDGLPVGHPTYNNYREDIATLFPGFANSNGAVGYYYVDTTQYANGVHTIAWSVEDSAGAASGIGSRYFTVINTGTGSAVGLREASALSISGGSGHGDIASLTGVANIPTDFSSPVHVRRGFNLAAPAELIFPEANGVITIQAREVDRIEVALSKDAAGKALMDRARDGAKPAGLHPSSDEKTQNEEDSGLRDQNYVGYLVVGNALRRLPIGSTLDPKRGVFSWQPGPGFVGEYNFVFISQPGTGSQSKKYIRVRILPAFQLKKQS